MTGVTHLLSRQAKEFWESPGYFAFCAGGVHLDARQSLFKAAPSWYLMPLLFDIAVGACGRGIFVASQDACRHANHISV
jgi:hypothetical protein